MDTVVCAQCGDGVEGKGVRFRDHVFCCDECCDEFEEDLSAQDDVEDLDELDDLDDLDELDDLDDLDENELVSRSEQDLGYRSSDEDDLDGLGGFDDDFVIDDDDF